MQDTAVLQGLGIHAMEICGRVGPPSGALPVRRDPPSDWWARSPFRPVHRHNTVRLPPAGPRRCATRGDRYRCGGSFVSSIRSRVRGRTSRYVALALTASALAVVGVDQTTQAHALSGRRLCMYVDGERRKDVWRFVVVNYRKSGGCPYVDEDRHPDLVSGDPNNIKKRTCEEVSDFIGYADDICRVLQPDMLYELSFNMRTKLPPERTLLGRVTEFA